MNRGLEPWEPVASQQQWIHLLHCALRFDHHVRAGDLLSPPAREAYYTWEREHHWLTQCLRRSRPHPGSIDQQLGQLEFDYLHLRTGLRRADQDHQDREAGWRARRRWYRLCDRWRRLGGDLGWELPR